MLQGRGLGKWVEGQGFRGVVQLVLSNCVGRIGI